MSINALITTPEPRNLWVRALLMLLMCAAFQLAAWILVLPAVVQLLFAIFNDEANRRLQSFGSSLGLYLTQIASFMTFTTEVAPFPFNDWPEVADT
ncbi:MAG: hypothetical protein B7X59_07020 [Polaromonas sp. 39-63-203]|jgi:hypothetical protein|uniref:DUF4389 domain-containing protein n=1 Tax=Polaromonas sp. TaxID=1869339 RepID=UPI000BCD7955|nr:DUF4389 domain-containing protein [Polaromonas sp.]OYY52314.1 MAG: hypothetical protein B7Y54_07390 [Polaromonas sp. 35-63-240]OYZ83691.1 MAG: hypothetical protein B7Y03_07860 [Polaromonas sp. 24-62-144]OZA97932.1 MAG: hypothetical protein B7X59_07020 [Polaromonas sp. 39-63-203]HQS31860.1 DUF4389 domain-containing protein [Polaromonas sp.]